MEKKIIGLKWSSYFNEGELTQLPYNKPCNLFSLFTQFCRELKNKDVV